MTTFEGKLATINYKYIESRGPIIFFNHGGHPTFQNIEYWTPLIDIMKKYCSPVLIDAPGHGLSEYRDGNNKIDAIREFINYFMNTHDGEFGIVGRSAGGRISVNLLQGMNYLGLIAPAGVDELNWKSNISILWDMKDPVIPFSRINTFKNMNSKIFVVGKPDFEVNKYIISDKKGTHIPEIEYPELFDLFMQALVE